MGGGNPHIVTHDGRTIRFPDPDVKMHDTVLVNLESGKIENKCKFEIGALCMIRAGNNTGRVGTITQREKDATGNSFCTRLTNVMVTGEGSKEWISLPKGKGIKLSNTEDRAKRWPRKRAAF